MWLENGCELKPDWGREEKTKVFKKKRKCGGLRLKEGESEHSRHRNRKRTRVVPTFGKTPERNVGGFGKEKIRPLANYRKILTGR